MKVICKHCGSEVEKPDGEVNRSTKLGRPMFCSLSCGAKYYGKLRARKESNEEEYNKSPSTCKCCGLALPYEKRHNDFCNQSCAAKVNNSLSPKKKAVIELDLRESSEIKWNSHKKTCPYCGRTFEGKSSRKYCSFDCSAKHKHQLMLLDVENGISRRPWAIRKYLIEKRGCKCEECGWDKKNPKTGKCPIEMEHIDGNHENNDFSNLKLLCPNCHSLTSTYKGANRGHGRYARMERYNSGKSF